MLFEIDCDNNQGVLKSLEEFIALASAEYKIELESAKKKIKTIGWLSPVAMSVPLPDEMTMFAYEEDAKVMFRIAVYTPRILKIFRKTKAMENNLKLFLESKGHKIKKIKLKGD